MEEIPWLNSADLVEESEPSSDSSLAPLELEMDPEPEAEHETHAPQRSRQRSFALAMLGTAAAGLAVFFAYPRSPTPAPIESPNVAAAPLTALAPAPTSTAREPEPAAAPAPLEAPAPAKAVEVPPARAETRKNTVHEDGLRAGFASLNRGDAEGALRRAQAIVDRSPERADAWLLLGSAYDALHDCANARQAFRACAQRGKGPSLAACKTLARD